MAETKFDPDDSAFEEINREKIKSAQKGFLGFFVLRHRFTIILAVLIAVWGVFSLFSLPREANPEVKVPFGIVTTVFPGASPSDVEDLVTDRIEEKLQSLENVREINSSSSFSVSSISVEFEAEADLDKSIQDLKDAVDEVTGLPSDAEDPQVTEVNFNDLSVVTVSLLGNLSDAEFKNLGDLIQEELEDIAGVSRVTLFGVGEREIQVRVNQSQLERLNLSILQVISALRQTNADFPLGDIEIEGINYNIRTSGKLEDADDVKNLVVANLPQGVILLQDVASVTDGLKEPTTLSRIIKDGQEPRPAISMQVFKKTGGNIIEIVDVVNEKLENLQEEGTIPSKVQIEFTNDSSSFIRNDLRVLGGSGLQTIVIIFVLLTLALSFRKGLMGALSIPLIFLMTFGFLSILGNTLNSLALFSLVLSLGLLVDAVIVLMEGIYDGLRKGYTPTDAALYSIETYKWPVIAGVFTTIAAFAPMFLVSGILGEFLKTFPITVSIILGSSLFVALIILPGLVAAVLNRFGKNGEDKNSGKSLMERYVVDKVSKNYSKRINSILLSRRKKWTFILATVGLLVLGLGTVFSGLVPIQLFPEVDIDFFYVNLEMPPGTTLQVTDNAVMSLEGELSRVPEIKNVVTTVGGGQGAAIGSFDTSGSSANSNFAQLIINLVDVGERDRKSYEIAPDLRQRFSSFPGGRVAVVEQSAGPPTGAPVEIRITGSDLSELSETADQISRILEDIPGVVDVSSDDRITPPEFNFQLDRERMGRYGLDAQTTGAYLRAALRGTEATQINIDGEDVEVIVKLQNQEINFAQELNNVSIVTPTGQSVKLGQIANLTIAPALETIRHRDLLRIVNVRADTEGVAPAEVNAQFSEKLNQMNLSDDISVEFGGEVEDIEQSFTELWYSMSVAVLLIFLILVLQFDSFSQPFIIVLTLPLAVIGVIAGTILTGQAFGFGTFLGIVALSGIVVNDAIVLIDRINFNLRERRLSMRRAVVEAGNARLQPIIMTTLTTIAGVTPLAFVDEFWRGLSVAIAFGIAFATILTLGVVPVLYQKFEGKKWLKN